MSRGKNEYVTPAAKKSKLYIIAIGKKIPA